MGGSRAAGKGKQIRGEIARQVPLSAGCGIRPQRGNKSMARLPGQTERGRLEPLTRGRWRASLAMAGVEEERERHRGQRRRERERERERERINLNWGVAHSPLDWLGRPALHLGGWKCSSCLIGAFALSSLSFYGIIFNLVIYLVQICGVTNAAAAYTVSNLSGTVFFCSFLGALLSDAYVGRLWTTLIFQILTTLYRASWKSFSSWLHGGNARFLFPMDSSLLYEVQGNLSAIPGQRKLQHTSTLSVFSFLDKAAVPGLKETFNPWHVCTVTQVEELKCLVRALPVGIAVILASVAIAQVSTLFEEQASLMNRQVATWLAIPPASLNAIAIGSSIFTGIAIMADGKKTPNVVFRMQKTRASSKSNLASIAGCGPCMRSVGGSIQLFFVGAGNYVSSILVTLVTAITTQGGQVGWIANNLNEGHLDYFYWLLASSLFLGLSTYPVYTRSYNYSIRIDMDGKSIEDAPNAS